MLKSELIRKLKKTRPDTVGSRNKFARSEKAGKAKNISLGGGGAKIKKGKGELKMTNPKKKQTSVTSTGKDLIPFEDSMEAESNGDSDDTAESVEDSLEQLQETVERKPAVRLQNYQRQEKLSKQVGKVLKRLEGQISVLKKSLIKKESKYMDKCFRCHEQGHKYADCSLKTTEDSDRNVCYRCGSAEHRMRNCPTRDKTDMQGLPFVKCFVCGERGHMSNKCPTKPISKNVDRNLSIPMKDRETKSIKRKNGSTNNGSNVRKETSDGGDVQDSDEEVQEIKKQKPSNSLESFEGQEHTPDRQVENNLPSLEEIISDLKKSVTKKGFLENPKQTLCKRLKSFRSQEHTPERLVENTFQGREENLSALKKSATKKGFLENPKHTPYKSLESFGSQEHTPERLVENTFQEREEKLSTLKKSATKKGFQETPNQRNWQNRRSNELEFSDSHSKKFQVQCFRCRQTGHKLADCKMIAEDTDQGLDICFRCGSTEHKLSNCQNKAKKDKGNLPFAKCFVCNEQGHLSNTCPSNPKGAFPHGGNCNLCGSVSHKQKDCPKQKEMEDQDVTVKMLKTGVSADSLD